MRCLVLFALLITGVACNGDPLELDPCNRPDDGREVASIELRELRDGLVRVQVYPDECAIAARLDFVGPDGAFDLVLRTFDAEPFGATVPRGVDRVAVQVSLQFSDVQRGELVIVEPYAAAP